VSSQAVPDTSHPDFAPFWQGCNEGRLLVPSCERGHLNWPPRPVCQVCYEWNRSWVEVSGHGSLFSWTVVHRTRLHPFASQVPYVVGVIALAAAGGLRMLGRCNIELAAAKVGLELVVDFEQIEPNVALPVWRRADSTVGR
jgi:uncharacterized OB-fold protein